MKTRRDFLQLTSMGIMGTCLPENFNFLGLSQKKKMSVQLYTIRDHIAKDFKGAIKKLSELGFENVETAFWPKGISLNQAAAVLN